MPGKKGNKTWSSKRVQLKKGDNHKGVGGVKKNMRNTSQGGGMAKAPCIKTAEDQWGEKINPCRHKSGVSETFRKVVWMYKSRKVKWIWSENLER